MILAVRKYWWTSLNQYFPLGKKRKVASIRRVLLKDNTNKVVDQRKGFNDKKGCELKNILKQILL